MKKHILLFISFIFLIGCSIYENDAIKPVKLKSLHTADTVLTVTSDMYETSIYPDVLFDSTVYVKSVQIHYYEPHSVFTTPRFWQFAIVDNDQDNIFTNPSYTDNFVGLGLISGFMFENQIITYNNLNTKASELWTYAQVNTNIPFTATVELTNEVPYEKEVIAVQLELEDSLYEVSFNDYFKVESIKVQHWGKLNRPFSITSNNDSLNISSSASVTNIKDYTPNVIVNQMNFLMPAVTHTNNIYQYGDNIIFVITLRKY